MSRALLVTRGADPASALVDRADAEPAAGEVAVEVAYSSVNYKDALALTGRPGVVRRDELVAGIDLVGTVATSTVPTWKAGDRVLVTGRGLGETHDGGLAERAVVPAEWLVPVPEAFSLRQAAAIGTAGFTAALAVGELDAAPAGSVVVTGARGGVGSLALALLARAGRAPVAVTRDPTRADELRALGAEAVIGLEEARGSGRPLDSERWAGAVDSLGGSVLAGILAATAAGGVVTACGLAEAPELPTTVAPFILRGVRLVGIDSVRAPDAARRSAWDRLARDLDPALLDGLVDEVPLAGAPEIADRIVAGRHRGRTVVDVRR